ncbi:hypothetical protein DL768_000782 [Monosporascus sp. mg162]|nr:hypothetical protein DL768_000782 [Monosporascus sp. mg162]
MPLHLLGKKSWNVYNKTNIERVRRDEAAARAREEAEEERQQEADAARRLAILRGETPPPLPFPAELRPGDKTPGGSRKRTHEGERQGADAAFPSGRKKRKRAGEDDTDFELRLAREKVQTARPQDMNNNPNKKNGRGSSDAPLTDSAGHIDLFPEEREAVASGSKPGQENGQKNEEAERETARKRREYEDQYTMRFSNAAGRDGTVAADGPWYAQKQQQGGDNNDDDDATMTMAVMPSKDVWGNEDPRRREREAARIVASDPLAMMRRGAAKVREVERERRRADEERERELKQLRREERRREKERKRRREGGGGRGDDEDELEGFSLDDPGLGRSERKHRHRDRHPGEDSEHRKHNRHRHHCSREDEEGRRHSPEHRHRHESSRSRSRREYEEDERGSRGQDHRHGARKDRY